MRNQTTNNPPVDDDLQQAIDNITNTTNVDPVFSDPVAAAPAPISSGDLNSLDETMMDSIPTPPAPEPMTPEEPVAGHVAPESVEPTPKRPEPMAPLNAMDGISDFMPSDIPSPEPMRTPEAPYTGPEPMRAPEPVAPMRGESLSMNQLKQSALRDLAPLLDHLNLSAPQKFNLYRNIFENLRDYTILARAYTAAKEISNETERAEALLYLIESIDKM